MGIRNRLVVILALIVTAIALPFPVRRAFTENDPIFLNRSDCFELLESHASRIAVRCRTDAANPSQPIDLLRTILAIPSESFSLTVADYSYVDTSNASSRVIHKGDSPGIWKEEDFIKAAVKTQTFYWHDLGLAGITINRKVIDYQNNRKQYDLLKIEFALEFDPQPPRDPDYVRALKQEKPSGGFREILPVVVLNPKSVPDFRRRPRIEFQDSQYCAEAIGRKGQTGEAVRVWIDTDGVYEISYADLKEAGASIEQWNLSRVNLWSNGTLIPVQVTGLDSEGRWNEQTRLRFWGLNHPSDQTQEGIYYLAEGRQATRQPFTWVQKNPRESSGEGLGSVTDELILAPEKILLDADQKLKWGEWMWLQLSQEVPEATVSIPLPGLDVQSTVSLTVKGMADLSNDSSMDLYWGKDHHLGTIHFQRKNEYNQQFSFPASWIEGKEPLLRFRIDKNLKHFQDGGVFLQSLTFQFARQLELAQEQCILKRRLWKSDPDLLVSSSTPIRVFGCDEQGTQLWDLDSLLEPSSPEYRIQLAKMGLPDDCTQICLISGDTFLKPSRLELFHSAKLHEATEPADALFICYPGFMDSVRPLVQWRCQEGWKARLINVQDIYDEFSSGYYSAQAIKDFITYTQIHWPPPIPQYVVLVGDTSYDPKNNLEQPYSSYLPFASYDQRRPISKPADEWFVRVWGTDALSDLSIGRISVASATDCRGLVDKILRFEGHPLYGPWRTRSLILTDNFFEDRCKGILWQTQPSEFRGELLQIRNYPMATNQTFKYRGKNEKITPAGKRDLVSKMNEGSVFAAYFGHGGGGNLAHEGWFIGVDRPNSDVLKLDNRRRLPFFPILSCLTGLMNYPRGPFHYCFSEEMVRQSQRGSIGVYGPSDKGGAQDHDATTRALRRSLYDYSMSRFGDVVNTAEGFFFLLRSSSRIPEQFNYFGDPLTRSPVPPRSGKLECFPAVIQGLEGGRLRIRGSDFPFTEGQGLLQFYRGIQGPLLRTYRVQLNQGSFEKEICWPPDKGEDEIRVVGYFWNTSGRQDAAAGTHFRMEIPKINMQLAGLQWNALAGEAILEASVENRSDAFPAPIEVTLRNGINVERRPLTLAPGEKKRIDFRILPEQDSLVELTPSYLNDDLRIYPEESLPRPIRLALIPDDGTAEKKELLGVDLSSSLESISSAQSIKYRYPLKVFYSSGSDLLRLDVQLQTGPATDLIQKGISDQGWWSYNIPVAATEITQSSLSLIVKQEVQAEPVRENAWKIPTQGDVGISHVEVSDLMPVEGYTTFFLADIRNEGELPICPGNFEMKTDQSGSLANPLRNHFNIQPPKLPRILQRGEIVRRLYRWDHYDYQGKFQVTARIDSPDRILDKNPDNDQFEFPLFVRNLQDYQRRLNRLIESKSDLSRERIVHYYQRALDQWQDQLAYEEYDENSLKMNELHRLAYLALGARDFDLAKAITEKALSLAPEDPGTKYLEANLRIRQNRAKEAGKALRAASNRGFFESRTDLAGDIAKDPRLVLAYESGQSGGWHRAEDLYYRVLEEQPANLNLLFELGEMYLRFEQYKKAAPVYQLIARLFDDDYTGLPERWFAGLGRVYAEWGRPGTALRIFNLGEKSIPGADFRLWKIYPLIDQGEYPTVSRQLEELDPDRMELNELVFFWYQKGRYHERTQNRSQAEWAYRKVLQLDSLHRQSRRMLMNLRTGR